MKSEFNIGNRLVGAAQPCYIVAEMSGNHGQDYDRALAIVRSAADAGADAVKMQAYTADTITLNHDGPDFRIAPSSEVGPNTKLFTNSTNAPTHLGNGSNR